MLQEQKHGAGAIVVDYHKCHVGRHVRSLSEAEEKAINDCGTSN